MEKINKYETALASIHIAKSLNASHTSQNLSKSMAAPTLTEKKARAYNKVYKSLGNKWLTWSL